MREDTQLHIKRVSELRLEVAGLLKKCTEEKKKEVKETKVVKEKPGPKERLNVFKPMDSLKPDKLAYNAPLLDFDLWLANATSWANSSNFNETTPNVQQSLPHHSPGKCFFHHTTVYF